MSNSISRIDVFSSAQRLSHWLITVGMMFELISAWLVQHADVDVLAWNDWHIMIGQALILPLAFRIYLLFRPGSGHWRLLIPTKEQRHIIQQTLKFYASLGRLPCPDWYAFNPVWQPIYLLMIPVMLLAAISGYLISSNLFLFAVSISDYHAFFSTIILYFTLLHIAFVLLHDVKGNGAQISAMLNGYKYFQIKDMPQQAEQNSVSLDSILKK